MKTWYDLSDKDAAKGCLGTLCIIFFFIFAFLYRDYETRHLYKHGVWTVLTITKRFGDSIHYKFKLNNQASEGRVSLDKNEINAGNRFFILVDPNNLDKRRIYGVVPEWFKLEPPPEGWKKHPTTEELQDMLWEDYNNKASENKEIEQNQMDKPQEIVKKEGEMDRMSNENNIKAIIVIAIPLYIVLLVIIVLYRKKKIRYIEEHGVWTMLSVIDKSKIHDKSWKVDYEFHFNDKTYMGSVVMSNKKIEMGGNRFFMMVVPDEEKKRKIYDVVPGWFTLKAPPKGWDKCPTEIELREMMRQNKTQ
jgi:hypothetical protein